MLTIFDPESHCDERSVLAILSEAPRSIREIGNRLRRNVTGVRVGEVVRNLAKRGVLVARHDDRRNAWIYSVREAT